MKIIIFDLILFAAGSLILYYGAEWLVKGASSLARSAGLSPVVIGLTIVAFGTSAPEFVVSIVSSIQNKSMIAVGNVVGSNICNIALVLGLTSVFRPLSCHRSVIRRDIPIMLGISLYLLLISFDSKLSRFDGATLFCGIIIYSFFNYYTAVKESKNISGLNSITSESAANQMDYISGPGRIIRIVAGIAGVVIGAEIVVNSAISIMHTFGISEKFIGLTVVAFGTSLPELATSVVAAIKKEMDISIGNLVGSNVFNILSVLGAASLIRPIQIPGGFIGSGLLIDYLAMILISFLPWLFMKKTFSISRKDGIILLSCYAGYLVYLSVKL
ncbi:MAG: calcium/sodium antiporter [Thermodesulfobacteriota bacterium]|nr:calcium/sodium antiporter [Thermodesulfobacteriota bacterium]